MIKPQPELSRTIDTSRIPPTGSTETIVADAGECAAVARRLGVPAIRSLKAELVLSRWRGQGVKVTGRFDADVAQICVVTLEPFEAEVSDAIERYFLPDAGAIEDEADIDPLEDGVIELGEVVVESLSLALDPYPRQPGAEFHDISDDSGDAGAQSPTSPFAQLAGLKSQKR